MTAPCPLGRGKGCGACDDETAADVAVLVRRGVVAVQVESAVVLVLAVVAADVQHDAAGVVVAVVVIRTGNPRETPDYWWDSPDFQLSGEMQGEGAAAPGPLHPLPFRGVFGDGSR